MSRERDLEKLADALLAVIKVLYEGQFAPNEEILAYCMGQARECGYEPPRRCRR